MNPEEELARKYLEYKDKEKEARRNANNTLDELAKLVPHKLGEIITWTETGRKRNVGGSFWHPKYEDLPDKDFKAVLTKVVPIVNRSFRDSSKVELYYKYHFKAIKKEGGISAYETYPNGNYTWTGEIHKDYQKNEEQ